MDTVIQKMLEVMLGEYKRMLVGTNATEREQAAVQLTQSAKAGTEEFLNTCDIVFGDRCYWAMDGAMRAVVKKLERQYSVAKDSSFDDETCVQIILEAQQTTDALKEMYDIRRRTTGTPANTAKGYYTSAMTYTRYLVQALDPDSRLFPNTTHYSGPPYVRNRERDEMIYRAYMEDKRSVASIAEELKISTTRVSQILKRLKTDGEKKVKQQKWKTFISTITNIFYCDSCRYTFPSVAVPERCPDCGAFAVHPATEEQIADYERIRIEIEAEVVEENRRSKKI